MDKAPCCVLVLCGIPGSGKSHLAAKLAASAPQHGLGTVTVIHFDSYTSDLTEEFDPETWKASRLTALTALHTALLKPLAPHQPHLVIIDDTMHYRSMRGECWRLAREAGAAYLQLPLTCPLPIALERNRARPPAHRIPEDVLIKIERLFEPPESSPCPWDKKEATLSFPVDDKASENDTAVYELIEAIKSMWRGAVPPLVDKEAEAQRVAAARQATAADSGHRMDVVTRRQLASALKKLDAVDGVVVDKDRKAGAAKTLNKERRRLMEMYREGYDGVDCVFEHYCDEMVRQFTSS